MKKIIRSYGVLIVLLSVTHVCAESKSASKSAGSTLAEIVKKLERSYTEVTSLKSEFFQEIDSPYWGVKKTSGTLYLNRPEKMRWDYHDAEIKAAQRSAKGKQSKDKIESKTVGRFFLADGKQIVLYDAKMSQAMVENHPQAGDIPLGLALLLGQNKLSNFFDITLLGTEKNHAELKLVPKTPQAGISHVELQVYLGSPAQIKRTRVFDQMGVKNEIRFDQIELNPKINAKVFKVDYPEGTVVVKGFSGTPLM